MKAALIRKIGGPEVIEFVDIPETPVGANDVMIKTSWVCLNLIDTYIRKGLVKTMPALPYILGHDLCGVVVAKGPQVQHLEIGQRVWVGMGGENGKSGTFAELVTMDADWVFPLPEEANEKEAVAAIQAWLTATVGLIRAKLNPGETLFVNGGSGNIGSAVIQLAKERGAKVIASAGAEDKQAWCSGLGADIVLDYRDPHFLENLREEAPQGINVIWETTKIANFEGLIPLLQTNGRFVVMSGAEAHPTFPVGAFYRNNCTLVGFSLSHVSSQEIQGYAQILEACFRQHLPKVRIAKELSLAETATAHKILETEKGLWGKIILHA